MDRFDEYRRMLTTNDRRDKTAFEQWNDEEITTEECWDLFLYNNGIKGKKTNLNNFIEWLWSLGYVKTRAKGRKETWQ